MRFSQNWASQTRNALSKVSPSSWDKLILHLQALKMTNGSKMGGTCLKTSERCFGTCAWWLWQIRSQTWEPSVTAFGDAVLQHRDMLQAYDRLQTSELVQRLTITFPCYFPIFPHLLCELGWDLTSVHPSICKTNVRTPRRVGPEFGKRNSVDFCGTRWHSKWGDGSWRVDMNYKDLQSPTSTSTYSVAQKDGPSHFRVEVTTVEKVWSALFSPHPRHCTLDVNFLKTKLLLYMKKFCPHSRPAQKTAAKCTLIPEFELER